MSDTARWTGPAPPQNRQRQPNGQADGANLADILERVLDKGIVIAGDIQVNLLDIELLTIKIRLVVASVDRAKEMGIDWWERDPTLSAGRRELEDENRDLRARVEALERGGDHELNGDDPADDAPAEADEDGFDDDVAEDDVRDPGGRSDDPVEDMGRDEPDDRTADEADRGERDRGERNRGGADRTRAAPARRRPGKRSTGTSTRRR